MKVYITHCILYTLWYLSIFYNLQYKLMYLGYIILFQFYMVFHIRNIHLQYILNKVNYIYNIHDPNNIHTNNLHIHLSLYNLYNCLDIFNILFHPNNSQVYKSNIPHLNHITNTPHYMVCNFLHLNKNHQHKLYIKFYLNKFYKDFHIIYTHLIQLSNNILCI